MAAEDMLFFKSAEEMRATLAARMIAKREGLSGAALAERTRAVLGNVEARQTAAEVQARTEGLRGLDLRRRVNELIEQSRPEQLRQTARDYALKVTFNGKPFGLLGIVAEGLNSMRAKAPVLNTIVPFVNIVANVANEAMHYLPPVGATRAIWGHWRGTLEGKPADAFALHEQWAKVFLGTAALAGVATLAAQYSEDEDPKFAITGSGPATPDQKKQLQATGWIPYSFKFGDRYVSYANTPGSIVFAALGNYMDAMRYRHLDQADALSRAAVAITGSGKVITEQTFLDGIAGIFRALDRQPGPKSGAAATRSAVRSAGAFVTPNILKQVDRLFDPTQYDSSDIQSTLIGEVPFARRLNRPSINALGDPVQRYVSDVFTSPARPDELLRVLNDKRAWISVPDRDVIVGDRSRGPDYYRTFDAGEYYDYIQASGAAIRQRLENALPRIEVMPPAAAKAYVQKVVEQERTRALRRFPR
jgi:hypothetical protein